MSKITNLHLMLIISNLLSLPVAKSFVIDCYYNEWDWNFKRNVYECQGSGLNVDESPGYVKAVTGIHMTGGNMTEVEALRFMHKPNITFLPNGIGKFFPNLKGLSFLNCNIKDISKEHLAEFPEMYQVSYSLNLIEFVPGDTFIYTRKLRLVNFSGNNIKTIGQKLLRPLKHLEFIWLEKNVCVDTNAKPSRFNELEKIFKEKCNKVKCPKIPRILSRWSRKQPEEICEFVKTYKFIPKPFHELDKLERQKVEDERKQKVDYLRLVLKICEFPDDIYRFFEIIYYKKVRSSDKDVKMAARQVREKKIVESLANLVKMEAKIEAKIDENFSKFHF